MTSLEVFQFAGSIFLVLAGGTLGAGLALTFLMWLWKKLEISE